MLWAVDLTEQGLTLVCHVKGGDAVLDEREQVVAGEADDAIERAGLESFTREPPKTLKGQTCYPVRQLGSAKAVAPEIGVTADSVNRYAAAPASAHAPTWPQRSTTRHASGDSRGCAGANSVKPPPSPPLLPGRPAKSSRAPVTEAPPT